MASAFFRFKQFTVWHDRCAMKVGTDGVLLGAWTPMPSRANACTRVLDIGAGSGLIALMLAQRLQAEGRDFRICGIDIDQGAVEQTIFNFAHSPWANHMTALLTPLQLFDDNLPFDIIVSNPPYFQNSLKNPNAARATARHTDTLTYDELLSHAKRLLSSDGVFAIILPVEAEAEIMHLAETYHLQPTHITYVHSKKEKPAKRILIAMQHAHSNDHISNNTLVIHHFYIESATPPRSEEYQALTREFYL